MTFFSVLIHSLKRGFNKIFQRASDIKKLRFGSATKHIVFLKHDFAMPDVNVLLAI